MNSVGFWLAKVPPMYLRLMALSMSEAALRAKQCSSVGSKRGQ